VVLRRRERKKHQTHGCGRICAGNKKKEKKSQMPNKKEKGQTATYEELYPTYRCVWKEVC